MSLLSCWHRTLSR
uniref:Uncharacterized protein n=1 Tax=Anguilla anguilla TaxID=7936 RepID=A0A0E9RCV4_ANGAN